MQQWALLPYLRWYPHAPYRLWSSSSPQVLVSKVLRSGSRICWQTLGWTRACSLLAGTAGECDCPCPQCGRCWSRNRCPASGCNAWLGWHKMGSLQITLMAAVSSSWYTFLGALISPLYSEFAVGASMCLRILFMTLDLVGGLGIVVLGLWVCDIAGRVDVEIFHASTCVELVENRQSCRRKSAFL